MAGLKALELNIPEAREKEYATAKYGGLDQRRQFLSNLESNSSNTKSEELQSVFGLPPRAIFPETQRKQIDSMPICHFFPSQPVFRFGLDLFFLKNAFDNSSNTDLPYRELLESHGFTTPNSKSEGIKVAFLADNFPTDTFTNEYGENFLQGMTDMASSTTSQIAQFLGVKDARELAKKGRDALTSILPEELDMFGTKINVQSPVKNFLSAAGGMAESTLRAGGLQNAAGILSRMALGARLDFPMVWKSSGFQPSYSMTIRLFNPNPRNLRDTKKYIVGPIVALMLLGVPLSQDGSTYSWPYLHRIVAPGIFELNPGFIQNITVIKGGDQQQIAQNQALGLVDVRIDIGSLYSSMVAGTGIQEKTRPTVRKYMNNLLQSGSQAPKRHEIYDRKGQRLGNDGYEFLKSQQSLEKDGNYWSRRRSDGKPPPSADQPATAEEPTEEPELRVSESRRNQAAFLKATGPQGYGFTSDAGPEEAEQ